MTKEKVVEKLEKRIKYHFQKLLKWLNAEVCRFEDEEICMVLFEDSGCMKIRHFCSKRN